MRLNAQFLALILSCSFNAHAMDQENLELATPIPLKIIAPSDLNESFSLPENTSKWRQCVTDYMAPGITTQDLQEVWFELLDLTMAVKGIVNAPNPKRRAKTIQQTYGTLKSENNEDRLNYLNKLLERHKQYIHQK